MQNRISDEVWQQLDPRAGQLSRPGRRRLAAAGAVGLLLAVIAAAGWYSGLVSPQLSVPHRNVLGSNSGDVVVVRLTVTNDGWFPVRVAAPEPHPGPTATGVDLLRVEGPLPSEIGPGGSIELTYVYRIVNCADVPRTTWHPSLDVARPWGAQRVTLFVGAFSISWTGLAWSYCRR